MFPDMPNEDDYKRFGQLGESQVQEELEEQLENRVQIQMKLLDSNYLDEDEFMFKQQL